MSEHSQSVMVALLPTTDYWCKIELPHVTLVYAGEIPDLPLMVRNELAKESMSIALEYGPFSTNVLGTDVFGTTDLVDVMRLNLTPELRMMRKRLEPWNRSEHTDYKPHATIGPIGSLDLIEEKLPIRLTFDRVLFSWGDSSMVFDLF